MKDDRWCQIQCQRCEKRLQDFLGKMPFVFKEDSFALQDIIPLKEINTDLQPVAVLSLIQLYLSAG